MDLITSHTLGCVGKCLIYVKVNPQYCNLIETVRKTPSGENGVWFSLPELLKPPESGQFPDESVKIKGSQIRS